MLGIISLYILTLFSTPNGVPNGIPDKVPETDYSFLFSKIDNQVRIYSNDSLIYDSEPIDGNPDLQLKVYLNEYLQPGYNTIRIELYNGSEYDQFITDKHWEIRYELFEDDMSVDYIFESSNNGSNGLVFKHTHEIFVE